MCKFCDNLKEYKTYTVSQRTTSADDNQCEFGSPLIYDGDVFGEDCNDCNGCSSKNMHFGLTIWDNNLQLSYVRRIKGLIIEPYSEIIEINFCPWCGKSLTDKPVDFDKCCCGTKLDIKEDF